MCDLILLSPSQYNDDNAHWEAFQGEIGWTCRAVVQLTLAMIEAVALLNLILSLFESIIAYLFFDAPPTLRETLTAVGPVQRIKSDEAWHITYFNTNEKIAKALNELPNLPKRGNVVVGVSGMQNFDFFIRRPAGVDHLVLIDPCPVLRGFWINVIETIKTSTTPEKAVETIKTIFDQVTALSLMGRKNTGTPYALNNVVNGLIALNAYLANREVSPIFQGWDKLKRSADEGKIIYCPVNLGDQQNCELLRQALERAACKIDTIYVSNVHDKRWLGEERTLQAVNQLLGGRTTNVLIVGDQREIAGIPDLAAREAERTDDINRPLHLCSVESKLLTRVPVLEE